MLVVGGFLLGILGVIGGPISLFKGLEQMKTLTSTVADYTPAGSRCPDQADRGRHRRHQRLPWRPDLPVGVRRGRDRAVRERAGPGRSRKRSPLSASLVGILLAVTRSGWLAIFMAGVMLGDIPILAIIVPAGVLAGCHRAAGDGDQARAGARVLAGLTPVRAARPRPSHESLNRWGRHRATRSPTAAIRQSSLSITGVPGSS